MRRLMAVVGSLSLLALAACGSSPPPPPKEPPPPPETFPEVNPADLAQLTPSTETSGAASPSPKADESTSASNPEGAIDACTPVGVDFEKRARPKLKDCYAQGKKKTPDLQGSVRISVDIDTLGKIKSTKITEKTLPEPVAQCMLKAVKETPFPEASKCPGKAITIPVTFPTPH